MSLTVSNGHSAASARPFPFDMPCVEPVIVTPYDGGSRKAPSDDIAFASRCAFSWQTKIVTRSTPANRFSFKTYKHIACFDPETLSLRPRAGDHITRTWDGARFQIVGVGMRSARELICEIVEIGSMQ